VFPEHLITAHEALIERRRKLREDAELRSASGEEWAEFEQHFLLRKVALGDCHRPYGTPCIHEHAPLTELAPGFRQVIGRASESPASFAA
jgi:hypothetical protein